jgi:hypothetical protein
MKAQAEQEALKKATIRPKPRKRTNEKRELAQEVLAEAEAIAKEFAEVTAGAEGDEADQEEQEDLWRDFMLSLEMSWEREKNALVTCE